MLGLSIACTVAAGAWIYLLAGHGGYWRTSQWLPRVAAEPDSWPDVVAVVPARNEAGMLPVTLPPLLGQDYPGSLSVIVVDDGSSDGTGKVAARIARASRRPLRVIAGIRPPDGERWAGKVWAMEQGLRAAGPGPDGGRRGQARLVAGPLQHEPQRDPGPQRDERDGQQDVDPDHGGHCLCSLRYHRPHCQARFRVSLRPPLPSL